MEVPSNAHNSKNPRKKVASNDKKITKVISGSAKTVKKNEFTKFADIFISEDVNSVKSYIVNDVLIPTIKTAISDIVCNGLNMFLFGERGRGKSSGSKVSYRNYYEREGSYRDYSNSSINQKRGFDYENIQFTSRGDAESVLISMEEVIEEYNMVSVADLYDMADISTDNYAANKYGWTNLASARVVPTRGGYIIQLPKPQPLNK